MKSLLDDLQSCRSAPQEMAHIANEKACSAREIVATYLMKGLRRKRRRFQLAVPRKTQALTEASPARRTLDL